MKSAHVILAALCSVLIFSTCCSQAAAKSRPARHTRPAAVQTAKPAPRLVVEVTGNPDAVPLVIAVADASEAYGLDELKAFDFNDAARTELLEKAGKSLNGKPMLGLLVIWPLKSGSVFSPDMKLVVDGGVVQEKYSVLGRDGRGAMVLQANAGGKYVLEDTALFSWWGISQQPAAAELQISGYKPINLILKMATPAKTVGMALPVAIPTSAAAQNKRQGKGPAMSAAQTGGNGLHVRELIGYPAVNGDPALQDYLSRSLGVSLNSDTGSATGFMAANKKGWVLAERKNPYGSAPGSVQLVSVAGNDGWWRGPDAANTVVLIEMLNTDTDPRWRAAAATALGKVGTAPAIDALTAAAEKDQDKLVRTAATEAMKSGDK